MASWTTRILQTSLLVTLLLFWTTVGESSVTWRRVSKPALKTTTPSSVSTISPIKKSSVTWKRSTITRRSTAGVEHSNQQERNDDKTLEESHEYDFDDIAEASSVQEERVASDKLESHSEIKPLVPGSRPGFWFDSRRKKPSSLLKTGARRNSLFPTRSTTTTTEASTIVTVNPLNAIPRTLPSVTASNAKSSNIRHSGLHRSTRAPVYFRRRLKTTRSPKTSLVQESSTRDAEDVYSNKDEHSKDKETSNNAKTTEEEEDEQVKENTDEQIKIKHPISSFRKRPYNGTRLSWIRKNSRTTTTTAVPQQVTTVSPEKVSTTQEYGTFSRKTTRVTKVRTRTRGTVPLKQTLNVSPKEQIVSSKNTSVVNDVNFGKKPTPEIAIEDPKKPTKRENYTESEDYTDDDVEPEADHKESNLEQKNSTRHKSKQSTTVEPFHVTRDYGKIVTAAQEKNDGKTHSTRTDADLRTSKKRVRTKGTEVPKVTTITDQLPSFETEYYDNKSAGDIDSSNGVGDYSSKTTTTTSKPEKYVEKQDSQLSPRVNVTPSPVVSPAFSTIGLDGDAYVVWSLGQGGSGWSYQKHGGEVKWSAQNSEAAGDRWSVVAKDEAESIEADLRKPWSTDRNVTGTRKSEKIVSEAGDKFIQPTRTKSAPHSSSPSASNKPGFHYRNDTILSGVFRPESTSNQNKEPIDISNSKFPLSTKYSTSVSVGGIKYLDPTNKTFSPAIDDKYKEEVEGIINQYPSISNLPYIAELRDIHKNSPKTLSSTKLPEFQEYVTEGPNGGHKQTSLSLLHGQQQLDQFESTNPYPTMSPEKESMPAYSQFEPNEPSAKELYNSVPAVTDQQPGYLSNIPPELAKAVVEEKKWHVVGAGGDDGWSLLNEDGVLEWKIHNVDGKWKVTSAEQLAKLLAPANAGKVQEYSTDIKPGPSKIWTLDDDYAKWRAVSSERGSPSDQFLGETSTSSQEYDYESQEYDGGPHSDDYYNNYPTNVNYNGDYDGRPAWTDSEDTSNSRPNVGNSYPTLIPNMEVANSREDAIDSWKSLISQQGYWKLTNNPQSQSDPRQDYLQSLDKNLEKQVSGYPVSVYENVNKNQQHRFYEDHEKLVTGIRKDGGEEQNKQSRLQSSKHPTNHKRQNYGTTGENLQSVPEKANFPSESNSPMRENEGVYRNRQENGDRLTESRIRIRQRDHPKLDSLIEKLENIQKETKGRAVVDLAKLLRQIKGQINNTGNNIITRNRNSPPKLLVRASYTAREENLRQANGPMPLRSHSKPRETTTEKNIYFPNEVNSNYRNDLRFQNGEDQPSAQIVNHQSGHASSRKENGRTSDENGEIYSINQQGRKHLPPRMTEHYIHTQAELENRMKTRGLSNVHTQQQGKFKYKTEGTGREDAGVPKKGMRQQNVYFSSQNGKVEQRRKEDLITVHRVRNVSGESVSEQQKLLRKQEGLQQNYRISENNYEQSREQNGLQQNYRISENNYEQSGEQKGLQQNYRISENNYEQSREQKGLQQNYRTSENNYEQSREQKGFQQNYGISEDNYEQSREQKGLQQKYRTSENIYEQPRQHQEAHQKQKIPEELPVVIKNPDQSDPASSDVSHADIRNENRRKNRRKGPMRKLPRRKGNRRTKFSPIVLKGETEVEDEESGSVRNRKIIVIDYAGTQKKKSSVDKKDLELIIRNVKHQRSEEHED